MAYEVDNSLDAYKELVEQAEIGNICAVIPVMMGDTPGIFMTRCEPTFDMTADDGTDYSGRARGQNYFGVNQGLAMAMAVTNKTYSEARSSGVLPLVDLLDDAEND